MVEDRIRSSREGIRESEVFLALGTKNYVRSISDPDDEEHHLLIEQISYAKSLGKPAAILLEAGLTPKDEKTVREVLKGMKIIGVFKFESKNDESMKSAVTQMMKTIDRQSSPTEETKDV